MYRDCRESEVAEVRGMASSELVRAWTTVKVLLGVLSFLRSYREFWCRRNNGLGFRVLKFLPPKCWDLIVNV